MTYYNEIDPYAVQWLRNLIDANLISNGIVDSRSIKEVSNGLEEYKRCHFFAGIAGWDLALQLAGWPAEREVWTGSCPCQPFSAAGKRKGTADERHLWPEFLRLIKQYRPATIFGEQVASKDGRIWLAGVRSDLEALGYVVGAADLCAAGVGAPHIRQRLYWMAYTERYTGGSWGSSIESIQSDGEEGSGPSVELGRCGNASGLADTKCTCGRSDSEHRTDDFDEKQDRQESAGRIGERSESCGFWTDYDLLPCIDGKARRVEPGTFPLAHGVSARVGKLRAYGNAIVPPLAAEFIKAFLADLLI